MRRLYYLKTNTLSENSHVYAAETAVSGGRGVVTGWFIALRSVCLI